MKLNRKFWGITVLMLLVLAFAMPMKADAAWKKVGSDYYYYNSKNKMQKKKWIGDYYVGKNGKMVTNAWVGKYFVGEDGKWIPNFKGGWQKIGKKWYYYKKNGTKRYKWITYKKNKYYLNAKTGVMRTGLVKINGKQYYFSKNTSPLGHAMSGWVQINKKYYYFDPVDKSKQTGWIKPSSNTYYLDSEGLRVTGFQQIEGKRYYFTKAGVMQKGGWKTIGKYRYYIDKKGVVAVGLKTIGSYTYYFGPKGVMQSNKAVTVNGVVYNIDDSGHAFVSSTTDDTLTDKMLFFTRFESGSAGYAQVGGDNGNAYGMYQFDYRYSLQDILQYCYSKNPAVFAEFKPYTTISFSTFRSKYTNAKSGAKYRNKISAAWTTVYNRAPKIFAEYQDAYAKENYYDVAANYLVNTYGISLVGRSDAVKGSVFSYAIQHGAVSAGMAVRDSKAYKYPDKKFIETLYSYRIKKFSAYSSRYYQERALALTLL